MSLATEPVDKSSTPDSTSTTPSTHASTPELVEAGATIPQQRFTEPQVVYLKTKIPDYRKAQADKTWDDTWAGIHGGFIQEWPQGPLTEREIAAGITREGKLVQELKVNQYFKHEQKVPLTLSTENQNLVQQSWKGGAARGPSYSRPWWQTGEGTGALAGIHEAFLPGKAEAHR